MGTIAEKLGVVMPKTNWQSWLKERVWTIAQRLTSGRRAKSEITVVKILSVGQKASVAMIEAEGCRLLLGVTSASVTLLKVIREEYVVRGVVK